MNNESTLYNEEKTVYDDGINRNANIDNKSDDKDVNKNKAKSQWRKAAAGFGFGILMGGSMSFISPEHITHDNPQNENTDSESDDVSHTSDGNIPVATSVTDEMSFADAFANARAEVGPGGVFEWNGNIYNTFYAEEWNNMSQEEKNEFASHLNVVEAQETDTDINTDNVITPEYVGDDIYDEEIEIHDTIPENPYHQEEVVPSDEIEILGMYEDTDSGYVYGDVMLENQEVIFVDIDNDSTFDYAVIDCDNDGQISEDEIADVSDYDFTYDDSDLLAL